MTASSRRAVERLAYSKAEAAEALGISPDHLERHVLDHLRIVYSGSRRLIPRSELERYLREHAVTVSATVERGEVPANGRVRASRGPVGGRS